ncbi:MAG: molybdopterin molybdotransferase MoeA [Actinomycetota bacterium]|nr:molybdopterin molybdotransferase MoeA [Actinomycetota bacterium]
MLDIAEARSHVLSRCPALAPRAVSYRDAVGLVLAELVVAVESVPPFVNSAVDGYAVVAASVAGASADGPVQLPVVGEVAAGGYTDRVLQPGEAIRIMTGAPMPAGADAVVMVEDTELLGDRSTDGGSLVSIRRAVRAGDAVRGAGDDVRAGTLLFPAGTVVRPAVLGVLASVNAREVRVVPRVRVAVLSTGDELIDDGSPLQPGQIRESNRTMLHAALAEAGCEVVDLGIVRDDEAALAGVLQSAAATCDAIVTSGGVSMGDYDVVKAVLSQLADMRWMQIAIKPAKPFAFGLLPVPGGAGGVAAGRQVPVFGLPGNPVSSLVSFELLARPALRQMMGHTDIQRPTVAAVADDGLPRRPDGKTHYVRVFAAFGDDGRVHVRSVGAQGSHQLAATSLANAIAVVADGDGIAAGGPVPTMLLSVG